MKQYKYNVNEMDSKQLAQVIHLSLIIIYKEVKCDKNALLKNFLVNTRVFF